ncbi:unnamed protein product, partial [Musa acuminata subsp. burmannicoides]
VFLAFRHATIENVVGRRIPRRRRRRRRSGGRGAARISGRFRFLLPPVQAKGLLQDTGS